MILVCFRRIYIYEIFLRSMKFANHRIITFSLLTKNNYMLAYAKIVEPVPKQFGKLSDIRKVIYKLHLSGQLCPAYSHILNSTFSPSSFPVNIFFFLPKRKIGLI